MKIGTVLVATDTNPLYCDFIPIFVAAWKKLIPEADVCVVMIADKIPEQFQEYSEYIKLFPPIPGMHTAFQAQCIRLLYPREITRDEGVLITDMDMLPMRRSYYVDSIAEFPSDTFIVYRDDCLPVEISMCYNVAHPSTWTGVFGTEDARDILSRWYAPTNYDGRHGGVGWSTDQGILVKMFNQWNGPKIVLNDAITRFARLCRARPYELANREELKSRIESGMYADYHCMRPYLNYKEINDYVVACLPGTKINKVSLSDGKMGVFSFCLYGERNPHYRGLLLQNIQIIAQQFPGWKVYIYIAPDVDAAYVNVLRSYSNVVLRETGVLGPVNMINRFYAIDEPNVDIMFVRNADSLIHWKDRWAIQQFLEKPEFVAHTIRDHIDHVSYLMGGLWGIRKTAGLRICDMYTEFLKSPRDFGFAHDQNFLSGCVYPALRDRLLVHYSKGRLRSGERGEEFPFAWSDTLYCGRIEYSPTTPFLRGLPPLNKMMRS